MSWEDQGRQEHGWFGHGTAPPKLGNDPAERSVMAGLDARIRTLGHCAITDIPRKVRYHHAASFPEPVMAQLVEAMGAWARGLLLDRPEFAARFFGRSAFDPVVDHLWQATKYAILARSPAEVQAGTYQFAAAMQAVGLDNWRRFLSDAQQRAASLSLPARALNTTPTLAAPVPFVDDQSKPVLDEKGQQMLWPAGLDRHFFVKQGVQDRKTEDEMTQYGADNGGGGAAAIGYETGALANFRRGGPWDAQRIGGQYHPEYVNYATVAIGLYAAANGIARNEILHL